MFLRKKNTEQAVNEFNQVMKPVSLWDDAWKRLKKNKMALAGLYIVGIYIAVSLFAPLLPLYPYEQQFLDHIYLPPSFKPAGVVMIAQTKASLAKTMAKEKRSEYTQQVRRIRCAQPLFWMACSPASLVAP